MTDDWAGRPGDRLGDFVIERLLGRGGFKSVYAARNTAAARNGWPERIAVCVPHAQDAEARELLRNEVRVVRTLAHPGIVQEFGLEESEGRLFTVMELVAGRPLNAVLAERGPLPTSSSPTPCRFRPGTKAACGTRSSMTSRTWPRWPPTPLIRGWRG